MGVKLDVTSTVRKLLIESYETREDDNLLILKVWAEQRPELRNKNYSFKDFAILFVEKKLSSTESIRRTRQKLQEEFPALRGRNYNARKRYQGEIKEQLKEPELYKGGLP